MRIAIFSDIHANLEAFEAVLYQLQKQKPDIIICLGDWVGYGPNPVECIAKGRELSEIISLAGNHDWAVLNKIKFNTFNPMAQQSIKWTQQQLSPADKDFLEALPVTHAIDDLFFVHSSPYNPSKWSYILSFNNARMAFEAMNNDGFRIAFIGHTHYPEIFCYEKGKVEYKNNLDDLSLSRGKKYIINVGSVGQPRDNDRRARYGIYDTQQNIFSYYLVSYPYEIVQKKIIESSLNPALAARLSRGL